MSVQEMWISLGIGLLMIVLYIVFVFKLPKFLFGSEEE